MSKSGKMDAEYNAMRRRMSRLRVKCGKASSLEAEDATECSGGDDPGFKDLIKYWKKHGIPIPDDLLSDMADEKVKQNKARGKGRRRSRELEDLHMCASTGKFNLEKIDSLDEDKEMHFSPKLISNTPRKKPVSRAQTESTLGVKPRVGPVKKQSPSGSSINGSASPSSHKKVARSVSKT